MMSIQGEIHDSLYREKERSLIHGGQDAVPSSAGGDVSGGRSGKLP